MTAPVQIVGSYLSPYVRKVLVVLHLKGVPYVIDPIVPFFGDERFSAISPLRRVPVLIDDRVTLSDSTVIAEYLDERHPSPPLLPRGPADRARARWLEEYADTRMGDVFIWKLFNQVAINPHVFGEPTKQEVLDHAIAVDVPNVLDYLESQLPAEGFLFGADVMLPDVAIASFFRNASFARYEVSAARWPRTAAYVARVLAIDAFQRLRAIEDKAIRTPIAKHREVLAALGAPLSETTYGAAAPRRGIMPLGG